MEHDSTFRGVLAVAFSCIVPVAAYYRLKAHLGSPENLDRRQEGLFIYLTLRPVAIAGMCGLIAFMINPEWMRWASFPLPVAVRWVGVGIGLVAGGLVIVVFSNLGSNLTDTVVTRKNHTLVTSGPYRWVRHPFYTATALAVTANALTTANGFIAATGLLTVALLVIRTRTEEQKLVERFGDDYRELMKRTGRFFPRVFR